MSEEASTGGRARAIGPIGAASRGYEYYAPESLARRHQPLQARG